MPYFKIIIKTDYKTGMEFGRKGSDHDLKYGAIFVVEADDKDEASRRAKKLFFTGASDYGLPVWHREDITFVEGIEEITRFEEEVQTILVAGAKRINKNHKYYEQYIDASGRVIREVKWKSSDPDTWTKNAPASAMVRVEVEIEEEEWGELTARTRKRKWNGSTWINVY